MSNTFERDLKDREAVIAALSRDLSIVKATLAMRDGQLRQAVLALRDMDETTIIEESGEDYERWKRARETLTRLKHWLPVEGPS